MISKRQYLLTCLSEEGVEVSKDIHKTLRFGEDDKVTLNPLGPRGHEGPTNIERMIVELNDFMGAVELLVEDGAIPPDWFDRDRVNRKKAKILDYLEYARRIGHVSRNTSLSEPPTISWHKKDGWSLAMLPGNKRPLIEGELARAGDEELVGDVWVRLPEPSGPSGPDTPHRRTDRPLAFYAENSLWNYRVPGQSAPCDNNSLVFLYCQDGSSSGPFWAYSCRWHVEGESAIIGWREMKESEMSSADREVAAAIQKEDHQPSTTNEQPK
jgi:hypothetical protein